MSIDPVLERCVVELQEIHQSMGALAFSRLADTGAWVHASWTLAQAQGAMRRAQFAPRSGPCELEAAAHATRSARAALRALESLSPRSVTPPPAAQAGVSSRASGSGDPPGLSGQ
jgi:hypothetical protein